MEIHYSQTTMTSNLKLLGNDFNVFLKWQENVNYEGEEGKKIATRYNHIMLTISLIGFLLMYLLIVCCTLLMICVTSPVIITFRCNVKLVQSEAVSQTQQFSNQTFFCHRATNFSFTLQRLCSNHPPRFYLQLCFLYFCSVIV